MRCYRQMLYEDIRRSLFQQNSDAVMPAVDVTKYLGTENDKLKVTTIDGHN